MVWVMVSSAWYGGVCLLVYLLYPIGTVGSHSTSGCMWCTLSTPYCWGGYFITTLTVQRMYALHYLLPFLVLVLLLVHIVLLHIMGSGSASTVPTTTVDGDSFIMYYYKDSPHYTWSNSTHASP